MTVTKSAKVHVELPIGSITIGVDQGKVETIYFTRHFVTPPPPDSIPGPLEVAILNLITEASQIPEVSQ